MSFNPFAQFQRTGQVNKFRNKKVEVDGIVFDSKKESKIYEELKALKQCGEIASFERQVTFELVPNQTEIVKGEDKKGRPIEKTKVVERAVTYIADFVVTYPDGEVVVIDAKGNRGIDQKYPIKRKLMLWRHKIKIKEV